MRALQVASALVAMLALGGTYASGQSVEELERRAEADPRSVPAKVVLAEAYLSDCRLEKSLEVWRRVLDIQPDHPRALHVVNRLTVRALDLDTQLDVLTALIEKGVTRRAEALLDAAAERAATDAQKARILCLRGALAFEQSDAVRARVNLEAAMRLYPETPWAGRAAIALAGAEQRAGRTEEARRLLAGVLAADGPRRDAVKQEARCRLFLLDADGLTPRQRIAGLRRLLPEVTAPEPRRLVLDELVRAFTGAHGQWVPEAVDALQAMLETNPDYGEAGRIRRFLREVAATSRDPATLDRLLALLEAAGTGYPALGTEAPFLRVEALLQRAVVAGAAADVRRLTAAAHEALDALAGGHRTDELRGHAYLIEAQKLVAIEGTTGALPVLTKAKEHYLRLLPANPVACLTRLDRIGKLLEHTQEWGTAALLYGEIAAAFPHMPQGRDALLRAAELHAGPLAAPMAALELYAEYAARYPAELPYRQLDIGRRLVRLGYTGVLDFQKRNRLKPDGIAGLNTRRKLDEIEAAFDMIGDGADAGPAVLRGAFVHPTMFRIARKLEAAGRHHDAIVAYRLFLNLFPSKREADDALIAVARLFRDNLLFEEALGAYRELIEEFPKGDKTDLAYIEAAGCLENLGRWEQAAELYDLYVKNFPKYEHVGLCKSRLALLDEVRQYQDFLATDPGNTKAPEAQYQIGRILYEGFKNHTKAAVEFAAIANRHPEHVRAADGLFMAGTAQLRAENFPAARRALARLVEGYPDSRLADDAQFWIGHTYEYSARALGRLDKRRIVLRQRNRRQRARLVADMALRLRYHPEARPGAEVPEETWGGGDLGVLTSGSVRDRVNADLFRAIAAYRKVVDDFKLGDMAGKALLRIGEIYTVYLKDPDKGIQAYQELLEHYPGSEQAMTALYGVGAYRLKNGQYDEAIRAYQQFIYNYPRAGQVADAMLAIARCHAEKKQWNKALDAYQGYLNKFPAGEKAEFANAQIAWIRMYHF